MGGTCTIPNSSALSVPNENSCWPNRKELIIWTKYVCTLDVSEIMATPILIYPSP